MHQAPVSACMQHWLVLDVQVRATKGFGHVTWYKRLNGLPTTTSILPVL